MEQTVERLKKILEGHVSLHEQLLALEEEKRASIVANDTARIDELTRREAELVSEVQAMEAERTELVRALAAQRGWPEPVRLAQVIQAAGPEATCLEAAWKRLQQVMGALRHRAEQNTVLLRRCLEHLGAFFAALAEVRTVPGTYTPGGQSGGETVRLLDQTA